MNHRKIRLLGVASITAFALALGACGADADNEDDTNASPSVAASADDTPSENPTPTVEPSLLDDLAAVEVSEDMEAEAVVTAPYPLKVEETDFRIIVQGDGTPVPGEMSTVEVQYTGINARTGEPFDSSWTAGNSIVFSLSRLIPGFAKGVAGQQVGSRMLIAIPSEDGYGPEGNPQAGIEGDDTLLFIVDILDTELGGPAGEPVEPVEGLPTVTESDGVPKIEIGELPEPTEVKAQALIEGSGRTMAAEDTIASHAVCSTWDGTEYYNDFGDQSVADAAAGATHQTLFGALVGQKMGSRVLVVMPGELAYPNGNSEPSIAPNTPVACVVDILFVQAAQGG